MNAIFYFSGTGNSRYVAQTLARLTGDALYDMTQASDTVRGALRYDRIGWVFPVHAWGLPRWVRRFIQSLPEGFAAPEAYVYGVMTCGDDIGLADRELRSVLQTKGMALRAVFSVQMPNTYVCLPGFDVDSEAVANRKLDAARPALDAIAADILSARRGVSRVTPGSMPWVKSCVLRPLFNRFFVTDRYFHAQPSCNGCHACSAHCPVQNIRHRPDGRPEWLGHCTGCLACYHTCPQHAVRFGHTTRHKGQYTCPTNGQSRRSDRKNETADRNVPTADRKNGQCSRHLSDHTQSIIHKP